MTQLANQDQATLWNGTSGKAWSDEQALLDGTYQAIEALLADAVGAHRARQVLDIGCGSGATTLAAARRVTAGGTATGIDISDPLLALARERAQQAALPARFIHADAQTHAFEPATYDLMISRFGVMFFDDPVAAFANLRHAAAPGCQTRLVVFRSIDENPFMTVAERAAAHLLPDMPPRKPNAPGQFGFADPERVRRIFRDSGWSAVDLRATDIECSFAEADLERYCTRFGPLGLALRNADETSRREMIQQVRAAFGPYVHGTQVRFTAACWIIEARAARAAPP